MSDWCDECQSPLELCVCPDDDDHCDRCGAVMTVGHCTDVEVRFPGAGMVDFFWCDDCADSFTAWRLDVGHGDRQLLEPATSSDLADELELKPTGRPGHKGETDDGHKHGTAEA